METAYNLSNFGNWISLIIPWWLAKISIHSWMVYLGKLLGYIVVQNQYLLKSENIISGIGSSNGLDWQKLEIIACIKPIKEFKDKQ